MLNNNGLEKACHDGLAWPKLSGMTLTEWLAAEKGRAAALAQHFDVSPAAVSQWKTNGVPVANMKEVREFTGGVVSLDEMVPDPKVRAQEAKAV